MPDADTAFDANTDYCLNLSRLSLKGNQIELYEEFLRKMKERKLLIVI